MKNTKIKKSVLENLNDKELPLVPENEDLKVGMGATYKIVSNSYSYTVVEVKGKLGRRQATLQRDKAIHTKDSDYYGHQKYIYEVNPNSDQFIYLQERDLLNKTRNIRTYRPSDKNRDTGRLNKKDYGFVYVGERREYADPHF